MGTPLRSLVLGTGRACRRQDPLDITRRYRRGGSLGTDARADRRRSAYARRVCETGFAIEVRHLPDHLVITNPGGLFGITVDRLGGEAVSSARNGRLLTICQYVRAPDDGARVVEALATGIPTVTAALVAARLPPALYLDTAIRFTVILRRQPLRTRPLVRGRTARAVWLALRAEPQNIAQLSIRTGLEPANLRRVLRDLRGDHLVIVEGGVGRETGYRRVPE